MVRRRKIGAGPWGAILLGKSRWTRALRSRVPDESAIPDRCPVQPDLCETSCGADEKYFVTSASSTSEIHAVFKTKPIAAERRSQLACSLCRYLFPELVRE